jgi:hypothetical protein
MNVYCAVRRFPLAQCEIVINSQSYLLIVIIWMDSNLESVIINLIIYPINYTSNGTVQFTTYGLQ